MTGRFQDKVVLITGGANGIGAGCARVFHEAGAKKVIIIDEDAVAGKKLIDEFPQIHFCRCSVSDPSNLGVVLVDVLREVGQLNCLINNVGRHPNPTSLKQFIVPHFMELIRDNVVSAAVTTRSCLPYLRKSQGSVINMSSVVASYGENLSGEYAATKAALNGFTKAWAIELAPLVRVNSVAPSSVMTPSMSRWLDSTRNRLVAEASEVQMHLLKRMATPEEIGKVCLFLATEDSSFITGQVIQVEGGCTLLHPRSA